MQPAGMKTPDESAKGRKALSAARQYIVRLLVLPAYFHWLGRDFVPSLAATRVVVTAVLWIMHDGSQMQLQSAFASAKMSCPADATLEPERNPSIHGTYYLYVTADTSERAQADLATLTKALQAAFPSAERDLSVSLNN